MKSLNLSQYKEISSKTLGEVFKNIRNAKNITAKEICEKKCACSLRALYNFESGRNCVNSWILLNLLNSIDVSAEDYFDMIFAYQASTHEKFIKKLLNCYHKNDISALEKILAEKQTDQSKNLEKHAQILMISTLLYEIDPNFQISQEILEKAGDYFFGIEQWGYPELTLFCNTAHILNPLLVISITKELIDNKEEYCAKRKNREIFLKILLNVSFNCVKNNCLKEAAFFICVADDLIKEQTPESTILDRIALKFIKGYYDLLDGSIHNGQMLMKNAIQTFRVIKTPNSVKLYEKYYDEALKQAGIEIKDEPVNFLGKRFRL
ncbi:MAG: hypothetical protein LBF82_01650 [Lactobacillales bacterium]|jgi:Rgg/GadR/MutR family transcriptional activator|nr:hypothetical protein [Lactobacillales bacterium]